MNKFIIGRTINGISLNGYEYVRTEDDNLMTFDTEQQAKEFMLLRGIDNSYFKSGALILHQLTEEGEIIWL